MNWRPLSNDEYPCNHLAAILQDVDVHSLDGKACSPKWQAVLDTGSDYTVVPSSVAAHLDVNFTKMERKKLQMTGCLPNLCPVLYLQISHSDFGTLEPVKAAFMDRKTILLGRDCLNQMLLTIHGPKKQFIVHQSRSWWSLHVIRFMPGRISRRFRPPG